MYFLDLNNDDKNKLISFIEEMGYSWSDSEEHIFILKDIANILKINYLSLQRFFERETNSFGSDAKRIIGKNAIRQQLIDNGKIGKKVTQITIFSPLAFIKFALFTSGKVQTAIKENLMQKLPHIITGINNQYSQLAFSKKYQNELAFLLDNIFHSHKIEHEKYVEGYRIDFLIDNYIAIECDEKGHDYYDPLKERNRELVMKKYNYIFFRYDTRDNNMLKFIGSIFDYMLSN